MPKKRETAEWFSPGQDSKAVGPACLQPWVSRVVTFGDSAAYWAPEPLPVCDSCGPGMVLIVNGSEPAKHRLQPHTRARHSSWRACASDALQAARVASRGRNDVLLLHLAAAPSVLAVYATAAACGIALVQLGDAGPSAGLIQCERTLCVAAGRWQCTAAHRLWRLVCPRQCC